MLNQTAQQKPTPRPLSCCQKYGKLKMMTIGFMGPALLSCGFAMLAPTALPSGVLAGLPPAGGVGILAGALMEFGIPLLMKKTSWGLEKRGRVLRAGQVTAYAFGVASYAVFCASLDGPQKETKSLEPKVLSFAQEPTPPHKPWPTAFELSQPSQKL